MIGQKGLCPLLLLHNLKYLVQNLQSCFNRQCKIAGF